MLIERTKYVVILSFGYFETKKTENTQNQTKLDIFRSQCLIVKNERKKKKKKRIQQPFPKPSPDKNKDSFCENSGFVLQNWLLDPMSKILFAICLLLIMP